MASGSVGLLIVAAAFLSGCASPPPVQQAKADPTREEWYGATVQQLTDMNANAERLLRQKQPDAAADLITKGEPLAKRLVEVPQPTLPAMQAVSDLDDLYGRMLLSNHQYGWARMLFQKNVARWKTWRPQNEESARRLKQAADSVAECDRRIAE